MTEKWAWRIRMTDTDGPEDWAAISDTYHPDHDEKQTRCDVTIITWEDET